MSKEEEKEKHKFEVQIRTINAYVRTLRKPDFFFDYYTSEMISLYRAYYMAFPIEKAFSTVKKEKKIYI